MLPEKIADGLPDLVDSFFFLDQTSTQIDRCVRKFGSDYVGFSSCDSYE